jgi:hypothetical protein
MPDLVDSCPAHLLRLPWFGGVAWCRLPGREALQQDTGGRGALRKPYIPECSGPEEWHEHVEPA